MAEEPFAMSDVQQFDEKNSLRLCEGSWDAPEVAGSTSGSGDDGVCNRSDGNYGGIDENGSLKSIESNVDLSIFMCDVPHDGTGAYHYECNELRGEGGRSGLGVVQHKMLEVSDANVAEGVRKSRRVRRVGKAQEHNRADRISPVPAHEVRRALGSLVR